VGFTGVLQLQLKSTMSDALLQALAEHLRIGHAAATELGGPVTLAELELPLGAGPEKVVGKADQTSTLTPLVAQHPKAPTREYLQGIYRPDNRALFEQLWPSVQAWAEEYTLASREDQAAPATTSRDDLYRPQPDEMELAIAQARTQDECEFLRSHSLDLRDQGKITVEEQVHLSALIEDRLDDLSGI
jgi:hypothetical protein